MDRWNWQDDFIKQYLVADPAIWVVKGPRRNGKTFLVAKLAKMVPNSIIWVATMHKKRELMDRYDFRFEQVVALNSESPKSNPHALVIVDEYEWIASEQQWRGGAQDVFSYLEDHKPVIFIGTPVEDNDNCKLQREKVHKIASRFYTIPNQTIDDDVPVLLEI